MSFESFFFFNDTATTEIYTLSLHDALPISRSVIRRAGIRVGVLVRGPLQLHLADLDLDVGHADVAPVEAQPGAARGGAAVRGSLGSRAHRHPRRLLAARRGREDHRRERPNQLAIHVSAP